MNFRQKSSSKTQPSKDSFQRQELLKNSLSSKRRATSITSIRSILGQRWPARTATSHPVTSSPWVQSARWDAEKRQFRKVPRTRQKFRLSRSVCVFGFLARVTFSWKIKGVWKKKRTGEIGGISGGDLMCWVTFHLLAGNSAQLTVIKSVSIEFRRADRK